MDDAKLAQVAQIVTSMSDAGMTVNEIKAQLAGMGLSEDDIEQVLSMSKAQPSPSEIHEEVKKVREKIETGEHLKPIVGVVEEAGAEAHEARQKAEEAVKKIEEVKQPVQKFMETEKELHRKIDSVTVLGEEVQSIKDMLIDMNANLKAVNEIMQKVLETNRKILQQKK